jgi:large subunit ribosomal protein L13
MEKKSILRSESQIQTLDATGKILGRLASEVATLLLGKNKASFYPYQINKDKIIVKNISQIKLSGKKAKQKKYYHYSGYPGGLKTKKFEEIFAKNPAQIFKQAVSKMLPKNKLRPKLLKHLKIEN